MSFSDRSIIDTIVTGVFDVDCCWCFTGLCVQQDVGTGGSQGCSIFWCSVTWSSTSSEPWQYLAFIFSPLCCPRTALASYLCQSESHSSWNKLLSSIFFGNVCALKGQGPCGGHFIFSNLHHFAAQMFGCFLGAYVSKLPELCWNRYFRTGDGNLYLCLVEWHKKIKSYFFMTMIPPHLKSQKVENSDMKLIQNPVLLLEWPHNHGGKGVLICAQGVCRHYRQKLFHMPVYLTALPVG